MGRGHDLAFLMRRSFHSSSPFLVSHSSSFPPSSSSSLHQFSREWPTVPQLFVAGEFVGGCDIMTSLFQSGELAQILEETLNQQKEAQKSGEGKA